MLYGFLKSAKPIHYLLTGVLLTVFLLVLTVVRKFNVTESVIGFGIAVLSLLVYQFIVSKNELTFRSAMGLWFFLWLLLTSFIIKIDATALLGLLFILLALRRVLSMQSGKNEIAKIFDASFWVSLSCFINPWYAALYIVVYVGIFLYARNQLRFWFIPFIAMICVGFLSFTIGYVFEIAIYRPWENSWNLVDVGIVQRGAAGFLFYSLLAIAAIFFMIYAVRIIDLNKRVPPYLSVLITIVFMGVVLMVINHSAPFSAALLALPGIAIFMARAAYTIQDKVLREFLLWLPVMLCVVNGLLYL